MKLNAVIVLYNPRSYFASKFKEMSHHFDRLFFVDNSTKHNVFLIDELTSLSNVSYIDLGENKGISYALDKGVENAIKDDPDYILTMDQDSEFPLNRFEDIKIILQEKINSDYGIISVNYNSEETDLTLKEVPWWITSGNFINVKAYKSLKRGFNVDLFIDGVDQDFCHNIKENGYRVAIIPGISLKHQIGNPVYHRILWKKFSTFNYPLFRYYYLFRNYYYLHKQDKKFYKKEFRKIKYFQPLKILLYEDNKKAKFRAAKLGKRDAKKGVLGPCKHEL